MEEKSLFLCVDLRQSRGADRNAGLRKWVGRKDRRADPQPRRPISVMQRQLFWGCVQRAQQENRIIYFSPKKEYCTKIGQNINKNVKNGGLLFALICGIMAKILCIMSE